MFRTAELGQKLSKKEYKKIEPLLRQELLDLQMQLRVEARRQVIIVFAGVDGAGKGATVTLLNEWMDTRWLINRAYREPSDEELERPEFWRFWRDLPPKGQIGLFLSSWYSKSVLDKAYGSINDAEFDECLDRIIAFEDALAVDGAIIIKFWMHLSRDAQKKRLKSLEKDPLLSWQVTPRDWDHWRLYDQFIEAAERNIMRTNTGNAPWLIVEGTDAHYRIVTVATAIRDALRKGLDEGKRTEQLTLNKNTDQQAMHRQPKEQLATGHVNTLTLLRTTILSELDLSQALTRDKYKEQLKKYQAKLSLLHRQAFDHGISTILVFEGPDAAGKGGAIRRVISALDPHIYRVLPFAAPTDEERAQHYLWRFWRHLSRAGHVTIFDRSWYGRVLVERVENFATEDEWRRAYAEINNLEEQLIERDIVLVKYWIHIDEDEQLARFKVREQTPHKSWKLTDEDWRNREKWNDYETAAHDMVQYTSTHYAPWVLVEGNNKQFARIKVLKALCDKLAASLKRCVGD